MKRTRLIIQILILTILTISEGKSNEIPYRIKLIDIKSKDGYILKGTQYVTQEKAPGVMLLSPCGSGRWEYEKLANLLVNQGLNVLIVDLRGTNDGNDLASITDEMVYADLNAIYEFFSNEEQVRDKIGILGASCSANFAFHLAQNYSNIRAIGVNSGASDESSLTYLKNKTEVPFLGVGSEKDQMMVKYSGKWELVDSGSEAKKMRSVSTHPKSKIILYEQKGHANQLFKLDRTLEGTIANWFVDVLLSQ